MEWVVWVFLAPVTIGLVEWAAVFAVGARQQATPERVILRRIWWCYRILFLAFFIAGVLGEPTAAVAQSFPRWDSQAVSDAFFWSQPARDALLDVLFFALDALGLTLAVGTFGMSLATMFYLRGPRPQLTLREEALTPRPSQLWTTWVVFFAIGTGLHVLATPDGVLLSTAVAGLSAFSFGLVVWVEWQVWEQKKRRTPRARPLTGRRRTVVAICAGAIGGSAASWAVLALLYEGQTANASGIVSRAGMMLLAALLSVVRALADLMKDRAETALS